MNQRIEIDIGGGLKLVAEANSDPDYDREIYIGVIDENERWLQDLACVRNAYTYEHINGNVSWVKGSFEILVWGNEFSEDYSDRFDILLNADQE